MKKIIALSILLLAYSGKLFAQEETDFCLQNYDIVGPEEIQTNTINEYTITNSEKGSIKATFQLYKNNKLIEYRITDEYIQTFKTPGTYTIKVPIDTSTCKGIKEKTINVYNNFYVYIGEEREEFQIGIEDNLNKQNILFKKIIVSNSSLLDEESLLSKFSENIQILKETDTILINSQNFEQILENIKKINNPDMNIKGKDIIIFTDLSTTLLKKVLAKYIKSLEIKHFKIIDENYFVKYLSDIALNKNVDQGNYTKIITFGVTQTPKYYFVSYIIDQLIYEGFPINLIGLVLILALATLVITFFRQVIGFSVFGIYSPLLFSISIPIIGRKLTLILFFIAFLATAITRRFTKKVYLLYSAKMSILLTLYLFLIIIFVGIDVIGKFHIIDVSVFNNFLIIFPIVFLLIVANKVFYEGVKIFSKTRWVSCIEFFIVSISVYGILSRTTLQHFLLSYPEMIIAILLLNIAVGRFTGLQLLEYFRFAPLLKGDDDEE